MDHSALSSMSRAELLALQAAIAITLNDLQKSDKAKAIEQIRAIAEQLGMTPQQLMEPEKPAKNQKAHDSKKVEPRYQNPDNAAEKWTGRGRQPSWVVKLLGEGKSLDSFKIVQ